MAGGRWAGAKAFAGLGIVSQWVGSNMVGGQWSVGWLKTCWWVDRRLRTYQWVGGWLSVVRGFVIHPPAEV